MENPRNPSSKQLYSEILNRLRGNVGKKRPRKTSSTLGMALDKISDDDLLLATLEYDLDASQLKYYTWDFPSRISFDFAFYRQFFLNIESENYTVSGLDCVICFTRLAKLLDIPVSNETTRMLIDMQESDGSHTIKWTRFESEIQAHENRLRFRRSRGPRPDMNDSSEVEAGSDALILDCETVIVLTRLERIYYLLEGDCYTKWRYGVALIRAVATLTSVGSLILESIPSLKMAPDCLIAPCLGEPTGAPVFDILQIVTFFIFLVDYVFKLFACGFVRHELMDRWALVGMGVGRSKFVKPASFMSRFLYFVLSPLALAEAAAVWPNFIRWLVVGMNDSTFQESLIFDFFRSLRILTLLKVLKLTQLKDITYILARSMAECVGALSVLFLVLGMSVLFLCILACIPESGQWYQRGAIVPGGLISLGAYYRPSYLNPTIYEQSPFYSIPASYWWAMMNITGYGDLVPTTAWGRFIGLLIALVGLAIISLPIAIISKVFSAEYKRFHGIKRVLKMSKMAEIQQRVFERITRDITTLDLEKKIMNEVASVQDGSSSSVRNDDSDDRKNESIDDHLSKVLLPKLGSYAESNGAWGIIIDRVESMRNQLSNGSLRNRNVYEFVNAATTLINDSNMPPSPTSSARSESSKLVYEIATYFVDKLNAQTNITNRATSSN